MDAFSWHSQFDATFSDQYWYFDNFPLEILVSDEQKNLMGNTFATVVRDLHSHAIMGFHLGHEQSSEDTALLAVRNSFDKHAVKEKNSSVSHTLPKKIIIDYGRNCNPKRLEHVCKQYNIEIVQRKLNPNTSFPSTVFDYEIKEFFSHIPGSTQDLGIKTRAQIGAEAALTLSTLIEDFDNFTSEYYNGLIFPKTNTTLIQRWDAGKTLPAQQFDVRDLNRSFLKFGGKRIVGNSRIIFIDTEFQGETLSQHNGLVVSVFYDPSDVSTIYGYDDEADPLQFISTFSPTVAVKKPISYFEMKAKIHHQKNRETHESENMPLVLDRETLKLLLIKDLCSGDFTREVFGEAITATAKILNVAPRHIRKFIKDFKERGSF